MEDKLRDDHILPDAALVGWKILQPIPVAVETQGKFYVVSDEVFLLYGAGRSISQAKSDYLTHLIGYYCLIAAQAEADPQTRGLYQHLQGYIQPQIGLRGDYYGE